MNDAMKAIVYHRYGAPEVLHPEQVPVPEVRKNEILIKIHATTATAAEQMMRSGKPLWGRLVIGLFKPKRKYRILGIELAGEVVATGHAETRFKKGDKLFGFAGFTPGACAEYMRLPDKASLATMPQNMGWNEVAGTVDGYTTARYFLKEKARLQKGQKILVIGASGSIGVYAVQLASHLGAEVTGVCSAANATMVKALGAADVIDYTQEDYTRGENRYDVIFDTVGKSSFVKCSRILNKNGCYLPTVGLHYYLTMAITRLFKKSNFPFGRKSVITGMSVEKNAALEELKEMLENGIVKPVIDKVFAMDKAAEAHLYVSKGHKKGNVVIAVTQ